MSTTDEIGQEVAVEQAVEHSFEADVVDEVAERERNLRPSVEQVVQARVDYGAGWVHEGRRFGQTLAAEERMAAYEWEIERTRERWDRSQDSDREARCRDVVGQGAREQRRDFAKRAASVDRWLDPDRVDAREFLSKEELGRVNREAVRIAERLGESRVTVGRRLAERVVDGVAIADAVFDVIEAFETAPGTVIPIARVGEVAYREVDIEGMVTQLWEPSHPSIQQVGLVEDDSGVIKFTAWRASDVAMVREGERVRLRSVARNWYRGRVSVALTGWSRVVVPGGRADI